MLPGQGIELHLDCNKTWNTLKGTAQAKLKDIFAATAMLREAGNILDILHSDAGRFLRKAQAAEQDPHTGVRLIGLGNNTAALSLPCLDGTGLIMKISASPFSQSQPGTPPSKIWIKWGNPLGHENGKSPVDLAATASALHILLPRSTPFLAQYNTQVMVGGKETKIHFALTADLAQGGRFKLLDPKDSDFATELTKLKNAARVETELAALRETLENLDNGRIRGYIGTGCKLIDPFVMVSQAALGQVVIGDWDRAEITNH